jgi:hypothetical protein
MRGNSGARRPIVQEALAAVAEVVTSEWPNWRMHLCNGKDVSATARLADRWFTVTTELDRRVRRNDHWRLLEVNADLPAWSRVVLATERRSPWLRVDVPLGYDRDVGASVAGAAATLLDAVASLEGQPHGTNHTDECAADSADIEHAASVREALEAGSWAPREVTPATFDVVLATRRTRHVTCTVSAESVRCEVVIVPAADPAPVSQAAIGKLLLLGTDQTPAVRGVVRHSTAGCSIALECLIDKRAAREHLDGALAGLESCADALGREIEALLHEPVAARYLEVVNGR